MNVIASQITSNSTCFFFNYVFKLASKDTSKSELPALWEGNPPVTGGFPSQKAGNTESFGSGNGLAPNKRQAITRTNDDPVQLQIYTSPGLNALR